MADSLREATIRISLKEGDVNIKAPSLDKILPKRKAEVQEVKKLKVAIDQAAEAEKARSAVNAAAKQNVDQLAEGFGQLASSAAVFATDTDENMQQLIKTLALVQGAVGLVKVSVQALGASLGLVAVPLAALAIGYKLLADQTRAAAEATSDADEFLKKHNQSRREEVDVTNDLLHSMGLTEKRTEVLAARIKNAGESAEQFRNQTKDLNVELVDFNRLSGEDVQGRFRAAIDAQKELLTIEEKKRDTALSALALKKQETIEAENQAKLEADKLQSFQAQVGALSAAGQRRLANLAQEVKAKGTGDLSKKELEFISSAGGEKGRGLAQGELQKRFQSSAGAGVIGDVFGNAAPEGKSKAVTAIEKQEDEIKNAFESSAAEIRKGGAELIKQLHAITKEIRKMGEAQFAG